MKHAELFAGVGGLSLAVEAAFGAELTWYAENDPAPSRIMTRHWPGIPNHGDVTQIDWTTVEPVDVLSGGSPCQDVSSAGKRAGMFEGTRSNLWVAMREAVATIQPTYVIWENVRGAHSSTAHSEVESEQRLLGSTRGPYLRSTGRVLGDLASLGYDAQWRTLSAASVGAPHRRDRVFILAWRRGATAPNSERGRDHRRNWIQPSESTMATRRTDDARSGTAQLSRRPLKLLPTVTASDSKRETVSANARENHSGTTLATELKLLPTPIASDANSTGPADLKRDSTQLRAMHLLQETQHGRERLGAYEPAIARWENVTGSPAPHPTAPASTGKHRLSERFAEWMMGLPPGWICDTPEIKRSDAIRAAGNGVVPQQATAALRDMIATMPTNDVALTGGIV